MIKPLGIIGSSGGAALAAASACLKKIGVTQPWVILADRDCGLLNWAKTNGHTCALIQYDTASAFSEQAVPFFQTNNITDILLFFTRMVDSPLIEKINVFNIHPSILPAFPGLHAVRRAMATNAPKIGATLHKVDKELDTGQVVLQIAASVQQDWTIEQAQHISFLQKTWLTLSWWQIMTAGNNSHIDAELVNAVHIAFDELSRSNICHDNPLLQS